MCRSNYGGWYITGAQQLFVPSQLAEEFVSRVLLHFDFNVLLGCGFRRCALLDRDPRSQQRLCNAAVHFLIGVLAQLSFFENVGQLMIQPWPDFLCSIGLSSDVVLVIAVAGDGVGVLLVNCQRLNNLLLQFLHVCSLVFALMVGVVNFGLKFLTLCPNTLLLFLQVGDVLFEGSHRLLPVHPCT